MCACVNLGTAGIALRRRYISVKLCNLFCLGDPLADKSKAEDQRKMFSTIVLLAKKVAPKAKKIVTPVATKCKPCCPKNCKKCA